MARPVGVQAEEHLHVRVLADRVQGLDIAQSELVLYDDRPDHVAGVDRPRTHVGGELAAVQGGHPVPRQQLAEADPPVVRVEPQLVMFVEFRNFGLGRRCIAYHMQCFILKCTKNPAYKQLKNRRKYYKHWLKPFLSKPYLMGPMMWAVWSMRLKCTG